MQDRSNVEITKDTSREEEIKNLVQAWEADQPGRSKKVSQPLVRECGWGGVGALWCQGRHSL